MQLFIQLFSRIQDRWQQQVPAVQAAIFASAAGTLILLACIISWNTVNSHEALFAGRQFSELELTAIESAFGAAGLNDYYVVDEAIMVPRRERATFVKALVDAKALRAGFDDDYQVELAHTNLMESQTQYRARVQMAKERSIVQCLRAMPEIDDASVHFDEVEVGGLHRERVIRAMVVVKPTANTQLNASTIQSIRALVASSKALLDPDHVTVTDLQSQISYAGPLEALDEQFRADRHARQRTVTEAEWNDKVRRALAFIPQVEVVTHIHVAMQDPPPSLTPDFAPWTPNLINVSVGIPHSYYHRIRRSEGPHFPEATPDSATIQRIEADTIHKVESIVQGLLPPTDGEFHSKVVVATFTDLESEPTLASFVDFWMQRLRLNPTLLFSVVGLALLGFLFVRGIWRDLRALPDQPTPQTTHGNAEPTPISSHAIVTAQDPESGPEPRESHESIHRELTRLVRDDPETAAEMLGEWVRKAG